MFQIKIRQIRIQQIGIQLAGCLLANGMIAQQLVLFDFTGASGDEVNFAESARAENLSVSPMTRGSGIEGRAGAGTFSARSWSQSGLDQDDYFEFSLTPDLGYQMSLDAIELDERRSGAGIRTWTVRTSLDSFASDLSPGPFSVPDNSDTRADQRLTLDAPYSSLTDQLSFRIYGFGAESGSGTWRVDNVEVFGQINPVPEPKEWGLVMGLLAIGFGLHLRSRKGVSKVSKVSKR